MIFLPHINTVILLEPYCGTITEPGLPVAQTGLSPQRRFNACRQYVGFFDYFNERVFVGYLMVNYSFKYIMIETEVKTPCRGNVKIFEHLLCCR